MFVVVRSIEKFILVHRCSKWKLFLPINNTKVYSYTTGVEEMAKEEMLICLLTYTEA